MYLMYVDESGDSGLINSPSKYFILTGLMVHELRWDTCLNELIRFRQKMKATFGLKLREEIHASPFINKPGHLANTISKNDRLAILRIFASNIANIPDISLINVVVDKAGKPTTYDVFEHAWTALFQRFDNTISFRNFPGPMNSDERGIVVCDDTQNDKLRDLLRKKRRYNPVPNYGGCGYRNLPITSVIEDPIARRSDHSYFIQAVDLIAYLVYQKFSPNTYMRKKGGHNYFNILQPIICRHVAPKNKDGFVML